MLLTLNIGNSSLRFGIFNGRDCLAHWIIQSKPHRSSDEYIVSIHSMMDENNISINDIHRLICASVVPELTGTIKFALKGLFGIEPVVINSRMKTGITFPVENPSELGADLLANAVAAVHLYDRDAIVIDFGTALSFTIVRSDGRLAGVVIAPGVISALGSLVADTAQLPSIELKAPKKVVGVETIGCIQSGIIHGYTGLFENIVEKIDNEQGTDSLVIAAGGVAHIFKKISSRIDVYDDLHTIKGLQLLDELNSK